MNDPAPYDHARAITATAEATQAVAAQAGGLGRYVAEVLGSTPHNLVGILNDRITMSRMRRAIDLYAGVKKKLEVAGHELKDLRFPSASIEVPLLEAATLEDRDGLIDLWEKLLAAAIAPSSRDRVRARHIEIIKSLEPLDALLLQNLNQINRKVRTRLHREEMTGTGSVSDYLHEFQAIRPCDTDEFLVAISALVELRLVERLGGGQPALISEGKMFLSVVNAVGSK